MSANTSEIAVNESDTGKQIRNLLRAILFVAAVACLYLARDFLLPIVLALFIALTLRPAVRYLSKHHTPPWLAATVFFVVLLAAGFATFYYVSGPVASWYEDAPKLAQAFAQKFSGLQSSLDTFTNLTAKMQDTSNATNGSDVQEVVIRESALPAIFGIVTGYPVQFLFSLLATMILAVFLMASGDLFYEKLVRILPTLSARKRALHIVYDIESEVSAYVLTLSAINFVMGVIVAVTFHALGMPLPYLWGVLAFFLNYVPYVGAVTGVALAGFMAIVTFDSVGYALLVPLAYLVISILESEILSPQVMGRSLQMNAVAILLSLAFWTWLWGIAGCAMALPLLVVIKIFCDQMEGLSGLGEFIATRHKENADTVESQP